MTLLIADTFSDDARNALADAGHTVVYDPTLAGDALAGALAAHAPSVLVVRSTKVAEAHLDAGPALELVVRAGAGVDTIDVAAASRRGVFVANCPGKNAVAVAELAWGLILGLDRRIPDNVSAAREGRWDKGAFSNALGLSGRTLGLLGMGAIGREMTARAHAFGMPVVAWSRSLTAADAAALGVERAATPLDVARRADVLSVHLARTPETERIVGAELLAALPEGASLVNTSRAELVDEAAVADAVSRRGLRYATDVPAGEPSAKAGEWTSAVAHAAYVTHHIGASTEQATAAIGDEALRVIETYAATGRVENAVNLEARSPATHLLTVRHLDRVGVLAGVLAEVREAGWNVQEMENLVFSGAEAACARIRFVGEPSDAALARVEAVEHVLHATILPL